MDNMCKSKYMNSSMAKYKSLVPSHAQADHLAKEIEKPNPDPISDELITMKKSLQTTLDAAVKEAHSAQTHEVP